MRYLRPLAALGLALAPLGLSNYGWYILCVTMVYALVALSLNILVGMAWQMAQVVIPMYLMVKDHTRLAIWAVVLFITTWLLKKHWWDRLDEK